jgi:hypothetical protein
MITLLLPLIGLVILWFEARHHKEYDSVITGALEQIAHNSTLDDSQKKAQITQFLAQHGYRVSHPSPQSIQGEKKFFYLSWLFITYGFYGLFYLWFQRPKRMQIQW